MIALMEAARFDLHRSIFPTTIKVGMHLDVTDRTNSPWFHCHRDGDARAVDVGTDVQLKLMMALSIGSGTHTRGR